MKIELDERVKQIMQKISSCGYHIYLVGGAVRDQLLGKENDDFDLCTDMPLEEIKKIFPNFVIMRENDHRNTGTIRIDGLEIEISSFRGKTLKDDLSERDFTMNALACDVDGNVIDYFNGLDDIQNKKISLVKKDGEALVIDPIRILRALRFQGTLGFTIDEPTKQQLLEKKGLLEKGAPERVYKEFVKILQTEKPSTIIRDYKEIFCLIIPELEKAIGFDQHNPYHTKDVFEHTLTVLDNTNHNIYLRLAALFHDLGKPYKFTMGEDGIGHFIGHADVSNEIFRQFARKYKLDKKTIEAVSKLVICHEMALSKKSVKITRFIQHFGTKHLGLLFRLKEADIKGQNPEKLYRLEELAELEEMYMKKTKDGTVLSVKDLQINGKNLMELGFSGEKIGFILKDVLNQITAQQLANEEQTIISYVEKKHK